MSTSGYMSSASFYIFLVITIILVFILCISNIVAYGNILANENIEFNRTWAKILIGMNAILIIIAFVILIILIIKFLKGRTTVRAGSVAASAAAGARSTNTIGDLKKLLESKGRNWDTVITNTGGDCTNPFNIGCSGDLTCSDGDNHLPCPGTTGNDVFINQGYSRARAAGLL